MILITPRIPGPITMTCFILINYHDMGAFWLLFLVHQLLISSKIISLTCSCI